MENEQSSPKWGSIYINRWCTCVRISHTHTHTHTHTRAHTHTHTVLNMLWELRGALSMITPNKNPEAELWHKAYNLAECSSGWAHWAANAPLDIFFFHSPLFDRLKEEIFICVIMQCTVLRVSSSVAVDSHLHVKTKILFINASYFIVWHAATPLMDIYDPRWT